VAVTQNEGPAFVNKARLQRWGAALSVGVVLFLASYLVDALLLRIGTSPSQTVLDNLVVGVVGAAAAYLWVRWEAEKHARMQERVILIAELNHHIRKALQSMCDSIFLQDQNQKLRLIDAAQARIDRVLTELVPTAGTAAKPRLNLDERDWSEPASSPEIHHVLK
jgi:hypothetical protein